METYRVRMTREYTIKIEAESEDDAIAQAKNIGAAEWDDSSYEYEIDHD